jgi:hypothetical protein
MPQPINIENPVTELVADINAFKEKNNQNLLRYNQFKNITHGSNF